VKQNGEKINIDFEKEDVDDNKFTMKIRGVEIRHHPPDDAGYDYLWFPSADPHPDGEDIKIRLMSPLELDNLHLPFNGGQTPPLPPDASTEVTIKLSP
jgi:hypothetical protein